MAKPERAPQVEKRLNRAARIAEAIVQSQNARADIEAERNQEYTGKHRKP